MLIRILISWTFIFGSSFSGSAQSSLNTLNTDIVFYCDVMMNALEPTHRERAFQEFKPRFIAALSKNGSYDQSFEELKWISRKYAQDSSFRIFTWFVQRGDDDNRYHGILQKRNGTFYELHDGFKTSEDAEEEEFLSDNWLGAMYYNIMDVSEANGHKYYILFGLNKWDRFENIKIADVLFFTSEGDPVFGKEVFHRKESGGEIRKLNRLMLKYSADAMVSLNFNPGMDMIVMDHLIPRMGRMQGQDLTLVPDGSYSGYVLEKGVWTFVDKLHTEVLDEAPRPKPVMENRKNRTIFGKNKKQ